MTDHADQIMQYLDAWAPDYPRRVTRNQLWSDGHPETVRQLLRAEDDPSDSPFISVYSFPRGHTKQNHIPAVNTLFIDFDFEDGDYVSGSGNEEAWRRDLSHLLVRARRVAMAIDRGDRTEHWRAALSGHKGIHLYLDFPELDPGLGSFDQYVAGLNEYATDLVDELSEETGLSDLDRYVDVTSSDLGRLCRVPNTLHGGATESFGEKRYCVPVTIGELTGMTPEIYEEYTREPRTAPIERLPSEEAGAIIEQYIQTAGSGGRTYSQSSGGAMVDWARVDHYRDEVANDDLTLRDAKLLLSDMPCVWQFHLREDKFRHGNQSHEMESHCIAKLLQSHFPVEVIKEFLSNAPEYDPKYTEERIEELIARDFKPYSTEKLLRRAPEFMNTDGCRNCQRVINENDDLQQIYN